MRLLQIIKTIGEQYCYWQYNLHFKQSMASIMIHGTSLTLRLKLTGYDGSPEKRLQVTPGWTKGEH